MPAGSEVSRKAIATRNRLPLTPSVTSSRRGGHAPIRSETVERPSGAPATPATPAMHLTPNVVIAARGTVSAEDRGRSFAQALDLGAIDVRRLRN